MSCSEKRGLNRQGLGEDYDADENRKSALLVEAQVLRAQNQTEAAAALLAQAAQMEERLSERCQTAGLTEKAWVHRFSAASCWAQAGNFYQAIMWCDDLLGQPQLPESLRQRVGDYSRKLRARRARWYAELMSLDGVGAG